MSEQNQSNFQALGAGLLSFVAVMAVGGGAMLVHRSNQAKAGAPPAAAAAPIDLGADAPRPMAPAVRAERRAQSPAPLIGDAGTTEEAAETAAPAAAAASAASPRAPAAESPALSPEAAPRQDSRSRLQVAEHVEASAGESTAAAEVKETAARERAKAPAPLKKAAKKAVAPIGDAAGTAVASVHYGATSRNELMGRAAGPVYNIKGGARPTKSATGKMADDATTQIAGLRKQLDTAGLAPEDRAKLQAQLDEAMKSMSGAADQ